MSREIITSMSLRNGSAFIKSYNNRTFPKKVGKVYEVKPFGEQSIEALMMHDWHGGMIEFTPSANGYLWQYVFGELSKQLPKGFQSSVADFEQYVPLFKELVAKGRKLSKKTFEIKLREGVWLRLDMKLRDKVLYVTEYGQHDRAARFKGLKALVLVQKIRNGWREYPNAEAVEVKGQ